MHGMTSFDALYRLREYQVYFECPTYVFIFTFRCISCGEWKGRVLISRAIMPMVTAVNVEPLIREVISQLNLKNQNQLHGLLLIVERMIADHSKFLLLDCNEHLVAHLLLHLLLDNQVISSE